MRQLYRAKKINSGKWIEGSLIILDEDSDFWYIVPRHTNASSMTNAQIIGCTMELVDKETVCKYTGCLTADIKKIFVNDIVDVDGIIGIVKFGKYGNGFHLGYYIQWINSEFRQELGFWEGKVKHLGNVFDNSELIKGRRTDI